MRFINSGTGGRVMKKDTEEQLLSIHYHTDRIGMVDGKKVKLDKPVMVDIAPKGSKDKNLVETIYFEVIDA